MATESEPPLPCAYVNPKQSQKWDDPRGTLFVFEVNIRDWIPGATITVTWESPVELDHVWGAETVEEREQSSPIHAIPSVSPSSVSCMHISLDIISCGCTARCGFIRTPCIEWHTPALVLVYLYVTAANGPNHAVLSEASTTVKLGSALGSATSSVRFEGKGSKHMVMDLELSCRFHTVVCTYNMQHRILVGSLYPALSAQGH